MEPYRTRVHGPAEVLRCDPGPHTELQTAYTQYKDEGGHTQQYSAEIGTLEVGTNASTIIITAHALCYSVAKCAAPVCARSHYAHVYWIQNFHAEQ